MQYKGVGCYSTKELFEKVGLLLLRAVQVVRQQQCNRHCLCDAAQAQQLKQQLHSAQVAGQWQGDTALTLPLFWQWSTVSPVFFGRYPRLSLHSFAPSLSVPVPNSHLASVDVKQYKSKQCKVVGCYSTTGLSLHMTNRIRHLETVNPICHLFSQLSQVSQSFCCRVSVVLWVLA